MCLEKCWKNLWLACIQHTKKTSCVQDNHNSILIMCNTMDRGNPGVMIARHGIKLEESPSGYVRPSILNEEDINAMDSEDVDDGGWAGAQEEIDYSVKLNFDDEEAYLSDEGDKSSDKKSVNSQLSEQEQKKEIDKQTLQVRMPNFLTLYQAHSHSSKMLCYGTLCAHISRLMVKIHNNVSKLG